VIYAIDPTIVERAAEAIWRDSFLRERQPVPEPWPETPNDVRNKYRSFARAALSSAGANVAVLTSERDAAQSELAKLRAEAEWRPIESAPRDGTVVDLWIVGYDDTVNFYTLTTTKAPGGRARHGRAPNFIWAQKPGNRANWFPVAVGGLAGYPLSPEVTATHWRPLPSPPKDPAHDCYPD
jgi:hypothetical protein